jgi:hypothetical protein
MKKSDKGKRGKDVKDARVTCDVGQVMCSLKIEGPIGVIKVR